MKLFEQLTQSLNTKEVSRQAKAKLHAQQWDAPQLSSLLPYRYVDEQNLFINEETVGFMLEVYPLAGANEQVIQALDDMLRKKMPRKTPVSVMLVGSKCIADEISVGIGGDMWQGTMADKLNGITRAFFEKAALTGFANKPNYPLYLRNYRIFITVAKKIKMTVAALSELAQLRNALQISLESAKLGSRVVTIEQFLSVMREVTNFDPTQLAKSPRDYNEDEEIHQQVVDANTTLLVNEDHLLLEANHHKTRIINLHLSKNPQRFALWQTGDNLQNLLFQDLGVPCPFVITWCMEVEEQAKSQLEANKKDYSLSKKAASMYGRLFPNTARAASEWRSMRQELSTGEVSLCRYFYGVTLFCPDDTSEAMRCELSVINTFRKNELELIAPRYQQMRNYLTLFPFMLAEGLWHDLKATGATLRCKTFNAVNLMPVVSDVRQGVQGLPLPTYRNQCDFFDMFSENENENFNIAVAGTSGAGKSFFTQSMLRQVLNSGGYAWVIDMGESYKNYCLQAGGVYLDGATLRFNPFFNVVDIEASAEGITRLLAVLASPAGQLDEVSEAVLQKAVIVSYQKKGKETVIDDVVQYLTSEELLAAHRNNPSILSRMAEIALLLEQYCTTGIYGEYFNSQTPSLTGDDRFVVLELLSLENHPKLMSAILFSLILAISQKMYQSPRDLKKLCIIDEAWRLFSGKNQHAADFIETGYRTVRRHRGAFVTITQSIDDFKKSPASQAAWNCSSTKFILLQNAKKFKEYIAENPDQFSPLEQRVILNFKKANDAHFSSILISRGERGSFHRLFVDPVTRALFSTRGVDYAFMKEAQEKGASSEEAAYLLAQQLYGDELTQLENWGKA